MAMVTLRELLHGGKMKNVVSIFVHGLHVSSTVIQEQYNMQLRGEDKDNGDGGEGERKEKIKKYHTQKFVYGVYCYLPEMWV